MANSYCETQLKRQCERIIKQGITIDNAAMLLAAALKYEASVRLVSGCELTVPCLNVGTRGHTSHATMSLHVNNPKSTPESALERAERAGSVRLFPSLPARSVRSKPLLLRKQINSDWVRVWGLAPSSYGCPCELFKGLVPSCPPELL